MAIRVEELHVPAPVDARIYRFPVEVVAGRAERRRAAIARRRSLARRRAAAGAVIVAVSVVMLFAGGPASVAPAAGSRRAPRAVVVQPGQTLWSLADRYAGEGIDPRAYVDAILALNGLDGPPQAGASIRLPR